MIWSWVIPWAFHRGFWTVEAHGDRGFHEGLVERGELTAGREVTPFNQLFVWTLA